MPGFTPNEGEALVANIIYKRDLTDRDADLKLGLFTDVAPDETITYATINQPTGGGYAEKTLTDASWAGAADTRTYATQTYTVTGTDYVGDVAGYYIVTQSAGGTRRLLHVEIDTNGPHDMNVDDSYAIDLSNVVA